MSNSLCRNSCELLHTVCTDEFVAIQLIKLHNSPGSELGSYPSSLSIEEWRLTDGGGADNCIRLHAVADIIPNGKFLKLLGGGHRMNQKCSISEGRQVKAVVSMLCHAMPCPARAIEMPRWSTSSLIYLFSMHLFLLPNVRPFEVSLRIPNVETSAIFLTPVAKIDERMMWWHFALGMVCKYDAPPWIPLPFVYYPRISLKIISCRDTEGCLDLGCLRSLVFARFRGSGGWLMTLSRQIVAWMIRSRAISSKARDAASKGIRRA